MPSDELTLTTTSLTLSDALSKPLTELSVFRRHILPFRTICCFVYTSEVIFHFSYKTQHERANVCVKCSTPLLRCIQLRLQHFFNDKILEKHVYP